MNRIWIAIASLAVVIGLCTAEIFWIKKMSEDIESQVEEVINLVSQGDIEKAISLNKEIVDKWNKKHTKLAIFIDHNSLEDIDESLGVIDTCLNTYNIPQFYVETARIGSLLEDLSDTEMLSFYNIL